ncbi:hypothetical protein PCANC_26976 [Puccinia coronata f. sp. avenae]|uniref:Uncharacterized protein n=1 Tax=Puccinia coronata f. sp. avenae TaxID=200324 RepID=A0A2N5TYD4_9BASI|nr:hypothetical protein PCANC_26976 [Puccinia coronata f. sp. avenae]
MPPWADAAHPAKTHEELSLPGQSGKEEMDLSFEQQEAAKRESKKAAKRAQQRLQRDTEQQQPEGAKLAANLDHSSRVDDGSLAELVSSSDLGKTKLHTPASHRSAAGGYPPVGYTFSPAALELLSRAQEQRLDADGSQGYGSALAGALLPPRPQDIPGGAALARDVSGVGAQQTHADSLVQDKIVFILNTYLEQWPLLANAKGANNMFLMRIALNLAISTLDTIEGRLGT